jgi:thiol-disulfide isomerase/thioredoxin
VSTVGPRNPDRSFDELPPQSGNGWIFFTLLVLVAACGYFFAMLFQMPDDDRHVPFPGPSQIGTTAPAIRAQGWFNGDPPTPADLQDKIILIDAWAYWCGPCRRKAPGLIRLHEEFAPASSVFMRNSPRRASCFWD